jgi:valacyclovir hydrolase
MPYATVNGIRLHFEQRGQGAPLLLIPGSLGTGATDFGPQLEEVSPDFLVIAPDPRGYGQSRPPERDFPIDYLQRDADDMWELMRVLGYPSFNVAGWSDGATSALLLTITHPASVLKMAIWGASSYISREDLEMIERTRSIAHWSPRMRKSLETVYGESLQRLWNGFCDWAHNIYQGGGEICRARLHAIRCPTLILHGQLDPLVPEFHPRIIHESIANSRIHVFPTGRHNPHLALANEFNQVLRNFLQVS